MWMSDPMPVMTSSITADSGSSRKATSTEKSPAAIQVYSVSCTARSDGAMPARFQTLVAATANDATIASDASPPDTALPSRLPSVALTRKPRNGKRGMRASITAASPHSSQHFSPFERREGVGVERLAVPEERDDQR